MTLRDHCPNVTVEFCEQLVTKNGLEDLKANARKPKRRNTITRLQAAPGPSQEIKNSKSRSGSGKSGNPGSARAQAGAETNEKSDDSQSSPESVEVSAPAIASVGADASTGSLFDREPKNGSLQPFNVQTFTHS